MYRFGVIKGDKRMEYLNQALENDGYCTKMYDDIGSCAKNCDIIILPIGMKPTEDMCGKTVFCSMDCDGCINYANSAYFKARNALPTAEGALAIAMQNTDYTISGSCVTVVGYGNIGKVLSDRLIALGANVTVIARREESQAEAENRGALAFGFEKLENIKSDIIFSTVPHLVITDSVIKTLDKSTLIIDLASRPGSVDIDSAERYGISTITALGLPGKVAPKSAGEILKRTILLRLSEV